MHGLGDRVEAALAAAGITPDRVARWLGRECGGCARRKERLNELGWAVGRYLRGRLTRAGLEEFLRPEEEPPSGKIS